MRIERAIDAYLDWRQLERDASPRSIESYRRILFKLAEQYPEIDVASITTADVRSFLAAWVRESKAERGIDLSASTRSNIISVLHSFFGWAESEDIVELDPSRKIRRPPKRKPDVYRPSVAELAKLRAAAIGHERSPILLMEGVGLRRSEVLGCRWEDIDLERQRVRVRRKGRHGSRFQSIRTLRPSYGFALVSYNPSRTTMCLPSRSSSGRRSWSGLGGGRMQRVPPVSRLSGGSFDVSPSARASEP